MVPRHSTLPTDAILEVLVCLPVKSLLRFKCVAKSWRDVITNPEFIKRHLNHAKQHTSSQNHIFVAGEEAWNGTTDLPCNFYSYNLDALHPPRVDLHLRFESHIEFSGSCDGLVCATTHKEVILFNPSTHAHKVILTRSLYSPENNKFSDVSFYMFGRAPQSGDYKVVRLVELWDRVLGRDAYDAVEVHIFSLKANSWKRANGTVFSGQNAPTALVRQTFVQEDAGYFYFADCVDNPKGIVSRFDLDNETSVDFMVPGQANGITHLVAIHDRLGFVVIDNHYLEVWILELDKASGLLDPWNKMLNILYDSWRTRTFSFNDHLVAYFKDKFLFHHGAVGCFYWFDIIKRTFIYIGDPQVFGKYDETVVCLSSLVPLE